MTRINMSRFSWCMCLAESSRKKFSDIIPFHVEEHLRSLAMLDCHHFDNHSCEYPTLRSVGAILPILKSLALKNSKTWVNSVPTIVLFRKKAPKSQEQ